MAIKQFKILYDPVPFHGGSKIAVQRILSGNENEINLVITSNKDYWDQYGYITKSLYCPKFLKYSCNGITFFIKNIIFAIQIIWVHICMSRISMAIGISGPGVDYALYVAKFLIDYKIIQLVQGPVPLSKTVGKCFFKADQIFYLKSSYKTIKSSIERVVGKRITELELTNTNKYKEFINGIPKDDWPQDCCYGSKKIFWAASLLKWKGLKIFINALDRVEEKLYQAYICYILPKDNSLPSENIPLDRENLTCLENPVGINKIRSHCEIFVSTSKQEPFGLSILESMAAGMCVVIPSDGAYWDIELDDGINCRKYIPDDESDLAKILTELLNDAKQLEKIGRKGLQVAFNYKAEQTYRDIKKVILSKIEV